MFKIIFCVSLTLLLTVVSFAQNKSIYTPISNDKCKTTTTSPVSGYLNCPGVSDYNLEVLDDDARMSINVVAPDQKSFELDFWGFFRNFSYVGEKAEWRVKGQKPIALIIRYNVSNRGDGKTPTSYLMVAKITKSNACVTDIVKPGKSQNLIAQNLADKSSNKPCKKP
ncbi:MAG: hypothetical protein AAB336_01940 [Acidobacteriota bacterium]